MIALVSNAPVVSARVVLTPEAAALTVRAAKPVRYVFVVGDLRGEIPMEIDFLLPKPSLYTYYRPRGPPATPSLDETDDPDGNAAIVAAASPSGFFFAPRASGLEKIR